MKRGGPKLPRVDQVWDFGVLGLRVLCESSLLSLHVLFHICMLALADDANIFLSCVTCLFYISNDVVLHHVNKDCAIFFKPIFTS